MKLTTSPSDTVMNEYSYYDDATAISPGTTVSRRRFSLKSTGLVRLVLLMFSIESVLFNLLDLD